jgi:hypothetical protein
MKTYQRETKFIDVNIRNLYEANIFLDKLKILLIDLFSNDNIDIVSLQAKCLTGDIETDWNCLPAIVEDTCLILTTENLKD